MLTAPLATLPATGQGASGQRPGHAGQGPAATPAPGTPDDARRQVGIDVFYAPLAEHGTWARHPDYDYVWVPSGLDASWRPYQEGRWIWTDDHGWYWDSAEPFAWATYHFGRWGYEPAYGWFWVPGDTWSPAWVVWRRGAGRTGWAPIAPDARGFAYGAPRVMDPPVAESWVFVDDRDITAVDLALRVRPIAEIAAWLKGDPQLYRPAYRDGVMTTRFIDRSTLESAIGAALVTRQLVFVDASRDAFEDDGGHRMGVYGPPIAAGRRPPAPPRFEREIRRDRRVLLDDYVREPVPALLAPSAALLSVLSAQQSEALRERRWAGDARAYQREIETLRSRERERVRAQVDEAARNERALQQRREAAIRARLERQQSSMEQRQQRAQQVIERMERERPGALPPAQGGDASRRGQAQAPGTGGPGDTPARRPNAPATPPDRPTAPGTPDPDSAPRSGRPEQNERATQPDRPRQPQAQPPQAPQRTEPPPAGERAGERDAPRRPPPQTPPQDKREEVPAPKQMDRPQNAPSPRAGTEPGARPPAAARPAERDGVPARPPAEAREPAAPSGSRDNGSREATPPPPEQPATARNPQPGQAERPSAPSPPTSSQSRASQGGGGGSKPPTGPSGASAHPSGGAAVGGPVGGSSGSGSGGSGSGGQ